MRGHVERLSAPLPVPIVDLRLERIPSLQQRAVDRRETVNDAIEPLPERRRRDPGAGKRLLNDEVMKDPGDLQAGNGYALNLGHPHASSSFAFAPQRRQYRIGSAMGHAPIR